MSREDKIVGEAYTNRLKNRIYGCLCEYEKGGTWEEALDSILMELGGFSKESKTIDYYTVYHKLSSARYMSYKYFRKAIFDVMSILSRLEV